MDSHHRATSSTGEEREVPGYRPVSRMAVVALVLGTISACALVSEFFLVVPLVAVAVACAALADTGREGAMKAGRLAAISGLALAIGFGAQATTAYVAGRTIAARRAVTAADIFAQAVRDGRQADAESMCGPEAHDAVATFAACSGPGTCRAVTTGDEAGTWVVRFVPIDAERCGARITMAPTVEEKRGQAIERWLVTAVDLEGRGVRPSGR